MNRRPGLAQIIPTDGWANFPSILFVNCAGVQASRVGISTIDRVNIPGLAAFNDSGHKTKKNKMNLQEIYTYPFGGPGFVTLRARPPAVCLLCMSQATPSFQPLQNSQGKRGSLSSH